MKSRPQLHSRSHGFTLVELLTVIAIIAILMGLLFPAIGVVKEQARKAEAKTTCTAIVAAVKAYYTEYGKYPVLDKATSTPADIYFGESPATAGDNTPLFATLRAKVAAGGAADYNPRRIVFFEGKDASNSAAPKSGFAPVGSSKAGAFFDPWGSQYNVIMDGDYDNVISIAPYSDFKGATKGPQTGCIAFSYGKDSVLGSTKNPGVYKSGTDTSDDVISWQ